MSQVDEIRGSGPHVALTDQEAAAVYGKSVRTYRGWQARGEVPRPFKVGRTNYTPPEAVNEDLKARAAVSMRSVRPARRRGG